LDVSANNAKHIVSEDVQLMLTLPLIPACASLHEI